HAGLRSGIALPYECGTGTCGTCKAKLVEGEVGSEWPDAPGHKYLRNDNTLFLMCQGIARADCALEVTSSVKAMTPGASLPTTRAAVIGRSTMLTHDVVALDAELERPMDFEAGQFVLVTVPGIVGARAYSMVNFDRAAERLAFVIKQKPGGRLSEWLFDHPVTDARVGLFGPLGRPRSIPTLASTSSATQEAGGTAAFWRSFSPPATDGASD